MDSSETWIHALVIALSSDVVKLDSQDVFFAVSFGCRLVGGIGTGVLGGVCTRVGAVLFSCDVLQTGDGAGEDDMLFR